MATKRTYTLTPIIGGKGYKVNYTVAGFSPNSPDEVKHQEYSSATAALRFIEKLEKAGYKPY